MSKLNLALLTPLLLTLNTLAFDGGVGSSGGGNLENLARERANAEAPLVFGNEFKNEVARYFEWIKKELPSIKNERLKFVFKSMVEADSAPSTKAPSENNPAVKDVWNSEYSLNGEGCFDHNNFPKSASSLILNPGTPVCLSLGLLMEQKPSNKELLALLVHEHIVHFNGLIDEDHAIMQWVMESVPKFYFAMSNISNEGCTEDLFFGKNKTDRFFVPIASSLFGGLALYTMMQENKNTNDQVHYSRSNMAILSLGPIALGINWAIPAYKRHARQLKFRGSVQLIKEASQLEMHPKSKLAALYQKLVLKSKDQTLKDRVTPKLFGNIILEANKRSTFCPLFDEPMTDKQIAEWIQIYLKERAPISNLNRNEGI